MHQGSACLAPWIAYDQDINGGRCLVDEAKKLMARSQCRTQEESFGAVFHICGSIDMGDVPHRSSCSMLQNRQTCCKLWA